MGMVSVATLTRSYLRLTSEQLDAVAEKALAVIESATSSISALSQSSTFDMDAANASLEAVENVRAIWAKDPNACADDMAGPALGHSTRFQPVKPPQGCTWGC